VTDEPLPPFLWADDDLYIRVTETRYAAPGDLRKPYYWLTYDQLERPLALPESQNLPRTDADYALYEEWYALPHDVAPYFGLWFEERKAKL